MHDAQFQIENISFDLTKTIIKTFEFVGKTIHAVPEVLQIAGSRSHKTNATWHN